jgi:hypothetical protein
MDLKQRFAILSKNKKIIQSLCDNEITCKSGIYAFYRTNEKGEKCFYIGQAKNLLQRTAQHLMGRQQHIDKSLYVHKLYSKDNPNGWKLRVLIYCDEKDLDHFEQFYIKFNQDKGFKSYNVTGGGQFNKKGDIGERQQTKLKSYKNGKDLGYEKARKEIQVFFEKYLDYTIKGKTNKTKERKLKEFKEWLEVQNELRETND